MISSTQYNLQSIVNSGLIRTICTNFDGFRIKQDALFDTYFVMTAASTKWNRSSVHDELAGVKFISFNYLFQSFHTLDMLLNNLNSPEQVLQAFP